MDKEKILSLISEALEVDPAGINMETHIKDVLEWDSLGWLSIMSLLDEKYGVQISSSEMRDLSTAGDLVNLILQKRRSMDKCQE